MSFEVRVSGETVRVLHVNRETGESMIVFRDHTQWIPTHQLMGIIDPPRPEEIPRLAQEFFGFLETWSAKSAIPDSLGLIKPLTVGNLYRSKPKGPWP